MISDGPGVGQPFIVCAFSATKKKKTMREGSTNGQKNRLIEMVMAVTVMLLMSDDSQGPRIGQSFIIFAFSFIKKTRDRQTDGPIDRRTNPLIEKRGRI